MKANEETTVYWKQQVQAFEKSGLSRGAYCEQNQIKIFQLDYWRNKFAEPNQKLSKPGWIPLGIKENGLNPYAYLTHLFERLPNLKSWDNATLDPLLPWNVELQ